MTSHVTARAPERSDWRTPAWFLDLVRQIGPIDLDPATAPNNPTGARRYYAQGGPEAAPFADGYLGPCGLAGSWTRTRDGLAFVNPPYGAHLSGPVEPHYVHTRKCAACDGRGARVMFPDGSCIDPCDRCGKAGRVTIGIGRGWAARIAQDPGEWLALVPTRTDAEWWHVLHSACSWGTFWRSPTFGARIQFVDPDTGRARGGSNLASSVFYHGPNADRFLRAFGPHGRIFPGERTVLDLFP